MVKGQGLLRQQEGGGNGAGKVHHRRHEQCSNAVRCRSVVDGQTYILNMYRSMYVPYDIGTYVSVSARSIDRDRGTGITA